MALEGILEEFGLADILQLIYFQKKTGTLNVVSRTDMVKLDLLDGNIVGLESKNKQEEAKLGKILIKKELITQDNLEVAIEIQKEENVKLGVVFLRRGLVSQEVLSETIKNQITESIAHIFAWDEGRYEFVPRSITLDSELPISIDTQHLLMDGLRTVDEWSLIEGKLDLHTIFRLEREPEPGELDDTEADLINLIDGSSDVSTIISVSTAGDFDTSKALISLEEKGIIVQAVIEPAVAERKPVLKLSEKPIIIASIVIGVIIFLFTLKGNLDDFRVFSRALYMSQLEDLKSKVDLYHVAKNRYPDTFDEIYGEQDPWGNPYIYSLKDEGFVLFSAGPDGVEGTDDDIY